jgi:hypothetical protein
MRFYRKHSVTLLLERIELDIMELDTSMELYVTGSASTDGERRRRAAQVESVLRPRAEAYNTERRDRRGRVDEDEPRGPDGDGRLSHIIIENIIT